MTRFGVDFAYGWKPGLGASMAAEGVAAIGRYCPYQGDGGKGLSIEEVIDYHANGLEVFLFWEQEAAMHRGGFARGKRDAEIAVANLRALGAPDTVAIYPAVDFAPGASDWPLIRDYQRGFISVAGIERTGIYGNFDVIEYAHDQQLASYFCQCTAWSWKNVNGTMVLFLSEWRDIFQDVGPDVAGIHVDHLTIYGDEYGQWKGDTVSQKDFDDLVLASFSGSEDRYPQDHPDPALRGKTLPREQRLPIAYDRMRNRADGGFGSIADRAESAYVIAQQGGAGGGIAPHTHTPGGVQ